MGAKIIKHVDDNIWRVFSGYCKAKDVRIGEELSRILKKELKNRGDLFAT